ncbi:hypothetical protein [Rhizobium sp. BK251]|uniref:hypothetical protein n=1 Tax=Rhizobium sp. BK251 TaxID=2512125 RepID=UPI001044B9E9|nr:hypothetical protein [Rhizobium sp. BK251]
MNEELPCVIRFRRRRAMKMASRLGVITPRRTGLSQRSTSRLSWLNCSAVIGRNFAHTFSHLTGPCRPPVATVFGFGEAPRTVLSATLAAGAGIKAFPNRD